MFSGSVSIFRPCRTRNCCGQILGSVASAVSSTVVTTSNQTMDFGLFRENATTFSARWVCMEELFRYVVNPESHGQEYQHNGLNTKTVRNHLAHCIKAQPGSQFSIAAHKHRSDPDAMLAPLRMLIPVLLYHRTPLCANSALIP